MMTYHNYEKFNLDLLSEENSKSELRFNKRDIYILIDHFETSEEIRCSSRITFLLRRKPELFPKVMHAKKNPFDNSWGFPDGTARPLCYPVKSQRVLHITVYYCNEFQPVVVPNSVSKFLWSS